MPSADDEPARPGPLGQGASAGAAVPRVPVCGVGASAGGVTALQRFFERVDPKLGLAYVVILHLDPTYRSHMTEILAQTTPMPVREVSQSLPLEPDTIYVIAPDRELVVSDDSVSAQPFSEPRGQRAPIDIFFRSLAAGHGDGIAVILTGAGPDGALGVRAAKGAGGVVLVQDPLDAEFATMPRSAIATGAADFVLPLDDMAGRIAEIVRSKLAVRDLDAETAERHVRSIIGFLRARTGHDFTNYKRATVMRRIFRRMQVARMQSLGDYADYMRTNAEEAHELFGDLLISVTMFFRDPASFDALVEHAIGPLLDEAEPAQIRVWVPGCATGEEAYSLAILFREEMARRRLEMRVQIFATDLDDGALSTGREGRYPLSIEADVSAERLSRFFSNEGTHYRVREDVREMVLFATHSALKDPPFLKLDLVSCRNLLIYLDRTLQRQICATFHYALNPHGMLFLGSAETVDLTPELFRAVDRDARIYAIKPHASRRLPLMVGGDVPAHVPFVETTPPRPAEPDRSAPGAHAAALEALSPPSAIVDDDFRVVHLSETAGRFIQPSKGTLSTDLTALVRPELRLDLKSALDRAFGHDEPTLTLRIEVEFDAERRYVSVHVLPVATQRAAQRRALVMFLDSGRVSDRDDAEDAPATVPTQVYEELRSLQHRLSTSRRDHEAAVQDLRAANEELQSINEEYRSTSEELETSKEELQSMNEELQTVNSELKTKLESISTAHSDLQNLVAATEIGTLFLDAELRIKLFTPEVTRVFNITMSDVGRPITDFTHSLHDEGQAFTEIASEARDVLTDLVPREREVGSLDGRWLLLRMRPYRTIDDRIDGVVVSFVDTTQRREAETSLRETRDLLAMSTAASRLGWGTWNLGDGRIEWDARGREIFGLDDGEITLDAWRARVHPDDIDAVAAHVGASEAASAPFDVAYRVVLPSGVVRHVQLTGTVLPPRNGDAGRGTGLVRDVTDEMALARSQKLLIEELNHRVKNMLAIVASVMNQTVRHSATMDEFVTAFRHRIQALTNAHVLLTETAWDATDLARLVTMTIEPFLGSGDALESRLGVRGPGVRLSPGATVSFAMALHELATNAVKYGALKEQEGRLTVTWEVEDGWLRLRWREIDGPPVLPPDRSGFGSKLLKTGIATELEGDVELEFKPDGILCRIEVPLGDAVKRS